MNQRDVIYNIINAINVFDDLEHIHKNKSLAWVNSCSGFYRIKKPNIPPMHLVCYFVVLNKDKNKILLGHHKAAKCWLPSGGHLEINEHPNDAVKRECLEELGIEADFIIEAPIFLTVTDVHDKDITHTDVTFWYILQLDENIKINQCEQEFHAFEWFPFESLAQIKTDPHMQRFIEKLKKVLVQNLCLSDF